MYVEFDLPVVPELGPSFSNYWSRYLFVGSASEDHQINALANTYMRLVEAAIEEYAQGGEALRQVWADQTSLGLRAMHRSISHFESCVTDMHRAIGAYRKLRRHKSKDPLSLYLSDQKPAFATDPVADEIRRVRDGIHHSDERVVKGQIPDGTPIALRPNGDEAPHPTEEGQTIKTFDRLELGTDRLSFQRIAELLAELSSVAPSVSQYEPNRELQQLNPPTTICRPRRL